jgi:hypothetical protein
MNSISQVSGSSYHLPWNRRSCCRWWSYRQAHSQGWSCVLEVQVQAQLLASCSWCGYERTYPSFLISQISPWITLTEVVTINTSVTLPPFAVTRLLVPRSVSSPLVALVVFVVVLALRRIKRIPLFKIHSIHRLNIIDFGPSILLCRI